MTLFKIDVEEKLNDFPNNEIEHLNDSFETNFPVNEPSNELYSPVNTILSNLSKQQVDINLDSNTNLRFVKYFVGETIRMRCIIPEGSHVKKVKSSFTDKNPHTFLTIFRLLQFNKVDNPLMTKD
ncbi:unnamed protein product [Schistosoma curassoni]|uniref:Uncharacterized protein n=1 Tax=Schistosoma curassoni TaxID=6186 RepID=A0A3P8BJT7_9TREM|nr:unnamed protein product [Schistosoma curassoni]